MNITRTEVDTYRSEDWKYLSEKEMTEIQKLEEDFFDLYFDARDKWEKVCEELRKASAGQAEYVIYAAENNAQETYTKNYACDDREDYLRELFVRIPEGYPETLLNRNDPAYFSIAYAAIECLVCDGDYPNVADAYYAFDKSTRAPRPNEIRPRWKGE